MVLSRRDFFRLGATETADLLSRGADAMGRVATGRSTDAPEVGSRQPTVLRPPGARPELEFLATCTRCDDCISACPKGSIRKAGPELGERLAGTPVIVPEEQPCWLCADMPCLPACEPGALMPLARITDARMGTIRIHHASCYASQGSICDACSERCPTRPRAVTVSFGSAPEVHAERCTGCGICAFLCPADAIDIVPA